MAALGATYPTLLDVAKRTDPTGKIASIAEMLSQRNEILTDMPWLEGNLPTGHQVSVRTGLPTVAWRLLNAGVPASKSTTAQITEACGLLEARGQVDVDIANLNGNVAEFRLSEAQPQMEAMNQEQASTLFYGNSSTAPEEYTGLSARYSSLSANNARNIIDGGSVGGQTDNTSIWLIVWGEQSLFGIYPKGSTAGLHHEDLGVQDAFDSNTYRFRAYMDHWKWKCGIALKDWRFAARICNIDVSLLVAGSGDADLQRKMIQAYHRIESLNIGRPVWYMNRTVAQYLDLQQRLAVSTGGGLTFENVDGHRVASFRGIPVRICDAIVENETRIT